MPKYIKHDCEKGFIDDYVQIQALKFNNIRHVVLNNMLGDFDEHGFYCVHPNIVKELIEMPKYIVEVMDNLEVCFSLLKLDKQISFLIAYEGEKVTLSLLEKVNFEANNKLGAGSWSNVNEYVLDSMETSGEIDRQALYLKWNVQTFAGEVVDVFNCEDSVLAKYFNIVNRFKENIEAKTTLLESEEKLEENEAEYFLDLMEILQDYPELNKLVQKKIKQTLDEKKIFIKLDKPNFVKTLNEITEKAIESNIKNLEQNEQDKFILEKRNITLKKNIKNYDIIQLSTNKYDNLKEREENLEDENIIDKDNQSVVTKIGIEDVKFKTLEDVANKFAQTEKRVNEKLEADTINLLKNKGKNKNSTGLIGKLGQVVDVLAKAGVAVGAIASAPIIAAVAGEEKAEDVVSTAVDNVKKANEKVAESKKNNKNEKATKSPEKKTTKKQANKSGNSNSKEKGKSPKANTSKANNTSQISKNNKDAKKVDGNNLVTGTISRRRGYANGDTNANEEGNVGQNLRVSTNNLNYEKIFNGEKIVGEKHILTEENSNNVAFTQESKTSVNVDRTLKNAVVESKVSVTNVIRETKTSIMEIDSGLDSSL